MDVSRFKVPLTVEAAGEEPVCKSPLKLRVPEEAVTDPPFKINRAMDSECVFKSSVPKVNSFLSTTGKLGTLAGAFTGKSETVLVLIIAPVVASVVTVVTGARPSGLKRDQ